MYWCLTEAQIYVDKQDTDVSGWIPPIRYTAQQSWCAFELIIRNERSDLDEGMGDKPPIAKYTAQGTHTPEFLSVVSGQQLVEVVEKSRGYEISWPDSTEEISFNSLIVRCSRYCFLRSQPLMSFRSELDIKTELYYTAHLSDQKEEAGSCLKM